VPLIRLARDKRGLDTLYLLHHRPDGRGEPRLRVIYFCAAPQGLDFGRQALDPQTQRALEQRYPEVAFDWQALLKEIEQRRLPPQVEPQARRSRPATKTERRPPQRRPPEPANGSGDVGEAGSPARPLARTPARQIPHRCRLRSRCLL
jgi:hypothetical protein